MRKLLALLSFIAMGQTFAQQVVSLDPQFANQNDTVTIIFDSKLGNGALDGVTPVYAHTGVITNNSSSPTDWQNVQGNWGVHDPNVLMTPIGNGVHTLEVHIPTFYNLGANDTVYSLSFVFRNGNGTVVGRESDGSDIFVPIYGAGNLVATFNSPISNSIYSLQDSVPIDVAASDSGLIELLVDGVVVHSENGSDASTMIPAASLGVGSHRISYEVTTASSSLSDSISIVVRGNPMVANPPIALEDGITILNDSTVYLQLLAPNKEFVYVLGDFNQWTLDGDYFMHLTTDSLRYWLQLTGLNPTTEYRFQYQIEENMRVAEIYAEKILDPWNDPWIPEDVYPNLIDYPSEHTSEMVSVFQIQEDDYQWETDDWTRPDQENLIIYELLIRDFSHEHSYQSLIDTLTYLKNLGVNAIELMPINEFEGNNSWGYNPMFYFAPDKYYGTKNMLKTFVDSCHAHGIAVIMDIALNHSFGSNPQVRMYFDPDAGQWGQPTAESPWFNEVPKHDFNVGFDYDHESPHTREFTMRVLGHWIQEYRIDGYRMDLSKGFTQVNSLGNVGFWGQYDQSRIDIWNDYGSHVWSIDSDIYMILEHFADNNEEKALSDAGFMLWGNIHGPYKQGSLGYDGHDISPVSHKNRGWDDAHLVGFFTSHDEERIMYENLEYGNSNANYDVRMFENSAARMELLFNFLLPVPGPKMIWQFDELGYDFPINYCEDGTIDPGCRIAPKPIRWDYTTDTLRSRVYQVVAALNHLKTDHDVFRTNDFSSSTGGWFKRWTLKGSDMNVTVVGNFNLVSMDGQPRFTQTGTWYEYYSGDSLSVTDVNMTINLGPGEYRLYTDQKLSTPDISGDIGIYPLQVKDAFYNDDFSLMAYPQPSHDYVNLQFFSNNRGTAEIEVYDLSGRLIRTHRIAVDQNQNVIHSMDIRQLQPGIYVFQVRLGDQVKRLKWIKG